MSSPDSGDVIDDAGSGCISYSVVLILVAVGLVGWWYFKREPKNWAQYGVSQPKIPRLWFLEPRKLDRTMKLHGDTVGVVSMGKYLLLTQDTALLKQVFVKDFNNFPDHGPSLKSKTPFFDSLFFAKGKAWRRLRHITTPSFATGKLRSLCPIVEESARRFGEFCTSCAESGKRMPVRIISNQYTSEVIARTAFGFKIVAIGNPGAEENEFTKHTGSMLKFRTKVVGMIMLIIRAIPGMIGFLVLTLNIEFFDPVSRASYEYFKAILERTLPERREMEASGSSKKPKDLLQSLVSLQMSDTKCEDDQGTSLAPLTEVEVIGQSMLVAFAGYDTTASTLQMALYLMSKHPEVQEKVYQEIQAVVKSDAPTHEELMELKYTEQVLNETLRLYPFIPLLTRLAEETKSYGDITIPAGTQIIITVSSLHMDPKHWPNPEKFDPERFSEEAKSQRDPVTFLPFGYGPRQCVGMRLAYLEMKMAIVCALKRVKFELNATTDPKEGGEVKISWETMLKPVSPIHIACVARS